MHCWAFLVIVVMLLFHLDDGSRELHDEALLEKLHRKWLDVLAMFIRVG